MRTAMSISVTVLMFGSFACNSVSSFYGTMEQSFFSAENQEIIARKNPKKPKGTPYRGSGRREFM